MDHGAVGVRVAAPEDVPAVELIVREAYSHYIERIGRPPGPMLDDYAALVEAGRVHVAERDGVVLGVLVLLPDADAMLLDNLAVAPAAQGTGVGRALLRRAELVARRAGCRQIRLYTNVVMVENVELYSRIGYVETGRGEENGFRRVYMTKQVA